MNETGDHSEQGQKEPFERFRLPSDHHVVVQDPTVNSLEELLSHSIPESLRISPPVQIPELFATNLRLLAFNAGHAAELYAADILSPDDIYEIDFAGVEKQRQGCTDYEKLFTRADFQHDGKKQEIFINNLLKQARQAPVADSLKNIAVVDSFQDPSMDDLIKLMRSRMYAVKDQSQRVATALEQAKAFGINFEAVDTVAYTLLKEILDSNLAVELAEPVHA